MKPKLTITVRRGLKAIAMLAESDLDADQSEKCPRYSKKEAREMQKALAWISFLDDTTARPQKLQA
jgi:hypothetical protein